MTHGTRNDYSSSPAIEGMQQISDFDEIHEVLRARRSFVQGAYTAGGDEVMRDTVVMLDGDEHLRRRRLLSRLTSDDAVQRYRRDALHPMIDRTPDEVVREGRGDDDIVHTDLVTLTQRCLYRIASVSAGIDSPEEPEAIDRFIGYVRAIALGVGADWTVGDPSAVVSAAGATNLGSRGAAAASPRAQPR